MTTHRCPTCGSMVELITIKNTGHDVEGEPIWRCPMCEARQKFQCFCQSYYNDNNELVDCTCGVCQSYEDQRLQVEADTSPW